MKMTECLNAEHGVFLTQLSFLEQLVGEQASHEVLRAVTRAIARAVEQHRHVEEKFLYPAILREFGHGFAPIKCMESEHEEIGRLIFEITRGSKETPALAARFIEVLREHIGKEIKILFPMSETKISGKELEEMTCQAVQFLHEEAGVSTQKGDQHG
jgi:hemerythrin-like domain-containing protein